MRARGRGRRERKGGRETDRQIDKQTWWEGGGTRTESRRE